MHQDDRQGNNGVGNEMPQLPAPAMTHQPVSEELVAQLPFWYERPFIPDWVDQAAAPRNSVIAEH